MEQRANIAATDDTADWIADDDSSTALDEDKVLALLESGITVEQTDKAFNGIANGILIGTIMWIALLASLFLFL
jgi:hypothetical protein